MTWDEARYYLAGMIDGEGCVYAPADRTRTKRVSVVNTDPAIIEAVEEAYRVLGIRARRYTRTIKSGIAAYDVVVMGQANLRRLYECVPVQGAKRERLRALVDAYVTRPQRREHVLTFCKGDPVRAAQRCGDADATATAAAAEEAPA